MEKEKIYWNVLSKKKNCPRKRTPRILGIWDNTVMDLLWRLVLDSNPSENLPTDGVKSSISTKKKKENKDLQKELFSTLDLPDVSMNTN